MGKPQKNNESEIKGISACLEIMVGHKPRLPSLGCVSYRLSKDDNNILEINISSYCCDSVILDGFGELKQNHVVNKINISELMSKLVDDKLRIVAKNSFGTKEMKFNLPKESNL